MWTVTGRESEPEAAVTYRQNHRFPTIEALFLDGVSAVARKVTVTLQPTQLSIVDEFGATLEVWAKERLHIDGLQEGNVLHVSKGEQGLQSLTVEGQAEVALIRGLYGARYDLPGGKRRERFIALTLAFVVGILVLAYFAITPLSRVIARAVPLEDERALGMQLEVFLSDMYCADPDAQSALLEIGERLSTASGMAEPVSIRILQSDVPNAFALPGGLIVVSTGLLHEAESEAEVAGVLGHELAHVTHRHVLAGFIRESLFAALWSFTVGDYAGLMVVDPTGAYRVANLGFSRDDEREADAGAVRILHRAGLQHAGLADFFERLADLSDLELEWLSTHPDSQERARALRELEDLPQSATLLSEAQWAALGKACNSQP